MPTSTMTMLGASTSLGNQRCRASSGEALARTAFELMDHSVIADCAAANPYSRETRRGRSRDACLETCARDGRLESGGLCPPCTPGHVGGPQTHCTAWIAAASCWAARLGSALGSLKKLVTTSNTAPCT